MDPYQILGISPEATKEEIKRAYRAKAKMYHPDLHPGDAQAAAKMNEVNEAYDMLQNPEKYAAKRQQEERQRQAQSAYHAQNAQGYYGPFGPFQNNGYSQNGSSQHSNYSQQGNGWYSDFGGFDFNDLFGFGYARQVDITPHPMPGDPALLVRAIELIRNEQYADAVSMLSAMTSSFRNARWYYVMAAACYGTENLSGAEDMIRRALQLEPNNPVYRQALSQYMMESRSQSSNGEGERYRSPFSFFFKMIIFMIVIRIVFSLLQFMMYGGFAMLN